MPRPQYFFVCAGILLLLAVSCSKSPQPASQQPAPAAAVAVTPEHMQDHFAKVREIEEAIIRGDLEAAKVPARWMAEHEYVSGASGTERPIKELRAAAESLVAAADIGHGAGAAATMVGACGSCHNAAKVEPKLPAASAGKARGEKARQMLEHQYAVDRMYRGLVVPVSEDWRSGAEALKAAPLRAKAFKEISAEIAAAEAHFQELADRAIKAPDLVTRVSVYGSVIGSCAQCHGLHGRTWGPGLTKTD
jgi:mono/diheme cytochrome c family protein